ncbi:PilZ domain-containing protein [Yoonia tamlensis]|uniref:PilZ domain-containing protein n=1 Tax=Yoonia tamlensis TaxID=390270 RepID=UPI000B7D1561|nr:PilZ domain-containing protein [Yoonia tamlensis]
MQHRAHRYRTEFPVELRTPVGVVHGKIADVNNDGARIERVRPMHRGSKISFSVLGCPVNAVVVWATSDQIGVIFRPRLHDDIVDRMRYRRDARTRNRHSTVGFVEMR